MIRSTCAVVFSFVVATVLVTSPQSTEAKDRRCRPRCCPQFTYLQPQPLVCMNGDSKDDPYELCAQWQWANFGSYCSYYATRCPDGDMPQSLDAPCDDPPGTCAANPQHALCATMPGYRKYDKGNAGPAQSVKPKTKLTRKHTFGQKPTNAGCDTRFERVFLGEPRQDEDDPIVAKLEKQGIAYFFQLRTYRVKRKTDNKVMGEFSVGQQCEDPGKDSDRIQLVTIGNEVTVVEPNILTIQLGAATYVVITEDNF